MAIIEVTSREFREKQKAFLDLADSGERVILKRGKKQAYVLVPLSEEDLYFTPGMIKKIEKSIRQAKKGEVKRLNEIEDIDKLLGL